LSAPSDPGIPAPKRADAGHYTPSPTSPQLHPFSMECPHCGESTEVNATQGCRCPKCNFEFTWFDPGQDVVAGRFYEVLTGAKYNCPQPGGGWVIVHG
jgi:hypothetical protein